MKSDEDQIDEVNPEKKEKRGKEVDVNLTDLNVNLADLDVLYEPDSSDEEGMIPY